MIQNKLFSSYSEKYLQKIGIIGKCTFNIFCLVPFQFLCYASAIFMNVIYSNHLNPGHALYLNIFVSGNVWERKKKRKNKKRKRPGTVQNFGNEKVISTISG